MSQPPPPSSLNLPGPVVRGFIALLFRGALGLAMLNMGLMNHLTQQSGMAGVMRGGGNVIAPTAVIPFYSHVQMVMGLAVLLGFLTRYAAGACGLIFLIEPAFQALALAGWAVVGNPPPMTGVSTLYMLYSPNASRVFLSGAVVWLSSIGNDPWSFDGLMYDRGRRRVVRRTASNHSAEARPEGSALNAEFEAKVMGWVEG